jgi:hypothetical protein
MNAALWIIALCGFVGALVPLLAGPFAQAADVARGRSLAQIHCSPCHFITTNQAWFGAPSFVAIDFASLDEMQLRQETELYLGYVHRDDMVGDAARLAAAKRHARGDGVATECSMACGEPERFPRLLAAHVQTVELLPKV